MKSGSFRFKDFIIEYNDTGCKVGTDGVLLGAWAEVANASSILDVGTGTGLIALMAANRNRHAVIHAVEIDEYACLQASGNVRLSPWGGRISIINDNFINFAGTCGRRYDAIVSNPPFFTDSLKSPDQGRNKARHSESLPHARLVQCCAQLLAPAGILSVIIPADTVVSFTEKAGAAGLFPRRKLYIAPYPDKPANRLLADFSPTPNSIVESLLYVRATAAGDYTPEYRSLTKDFYLNF